MRRFFFNEKDIRGDRVLISGDEAHHIKDVIRLKPGERFLGFDGTGRTYTLRVEKTTDKVEAIIEKVSAKKIDMPKILLACAMPKARKIEDIIEKATELGVSDIIPMLTQRTIVKIDNKAKAAKKKRWERIAIEAAKQCGREELPCIHEIKDLKDSISLSLELGYNKIVMPCVCEGTKSLEETMHGALKNIAIFIGPEGDFSTKETEIARGSGVDMVSLGPLVLRVDTACIYTISAVQAIYRRDR